MFCPNCGRDCGEAKFCSECGQNIYPKPPFAEKSVLRGDLVFGEQEVILITRLPRVQEATYVFPYDQIFDTTFVPATRWFTGFLCIRDWKNRFIALPERQGQKNCMDSMIWFEERDNVTFYRAYEFLKQWAAINARQRKKDKKSTPPG